VVRNARVCRAGKIFSLADLPAYNSIFMPPDAMLRRMTFVEA
jgi:hypothetical protein